MAVSSQSTSSGEINNFFGQKQTKLLVKTRNILATLYTFYNLKEEISLTG